MTRTEAVAMINQGIGFRPTGNPLEGAIILKLQEAQRDLEKGRTLPKFLLQEDQTLTLVAGTSGVALPAGFLRESDETRIRYFPSASTSAKQVFLERRFLIDAVEANASTLDVSPVGGTRPPSVYVMRKSTISFINRADQTYTLLWDYYKAGALLTSDIENVWLANAPEWLWGEAGYRIALDLVNAADAVAKFDKIRMMGRIAAFSEDITEELASGPLQMGANL